jgi:hypothetical protein
VRLVGGRLCGTGDPAEAPAEWARRLLPLELPDSGKLGL